MDRQLDDSCRDACLSLESVAFVSKDDLPVGSITIAIAFGDIVIDGEPCTSCKIADHLRRSRDFQAVRANARLIQRQRQRGKRLGLVSRELRDAALLSTTSSRLGESIGDPTLCTMCTPECIAQLAPDVCEREQGQKITCVTLQAMTRCVFSHIHLCMSFIYVIYVCNLFLLPEIYTVIMSSSSFSREPFPYAVTSETP